MHTIHIPLPNIMGDHLWILGVFLFFISQIMVCVGMQIQKCAHTRLQESSSNTHYVRNPRWIIGFSIDIQSLSAICDFFALAFASQSVLAPIASTTLIFNMCWTPVMQHVCVKTVIITLCIAIGTVLTVIFSPKEQHNATELEHIFDIYKSWQFLIYEITSFLATSALTILASFGPMHWKALPLKSRSLTNLLWKDVSHKKGRVIVIPYWFPMWF